MMRRTLIVAHLAVCAAVALAACGGVVGGSTAAGSGSAGKGGVGGGSAEAASPSTPAQPPTRSPGCGGDADVQVDPRATPAPICLSVGEAVRVGTGISPHQPWKPFVSSDPTVVSCTSVRVPDGAVQGTCRALRPGIAVITTGTMPFAGDPHGPAQYDWQLEITVG